MPFLSSPSFFSASLQQQPRTVTIPDLQKIDKISMAVEARHLNLFPSQLLGNREMMNPIEGSAGLYNTQMGFGHGVPLSGTTTVETTNLVPMYGGCSVIADSVPAKLSMKSDSGLTYNLPIVSRKRPRVASDPTAQKSPTLFSFLGEDLSAQIQQQQQDLDRLVSHHMEKVRIEMEEKRKREARWIVEVLEEGMVKRLRAKEEEIVKMGKMNWALEERVKSLCVENQIWRDLAHTNEATANSLRASLEQVLAQQQQQNQVSGGGDDDAESCCGSTSDAADGWRAVNNNNVVGNKNRVVVCRSCRKEEACVLLLPCRHLCLCTACGSTVHTCPVCKATKNASVHVNMSSS